MKILKQGKLPEGAIKYRCHYCGCVFIAEKGEYEQVPIQYNETDCKCDCPCCGAECVENR